MMSLRIHMRLIKFSLFINSLDEETERTLSKYSLGEPTRAEVCLPSSLGVCWLLSAHHISNSSTERSKETELHGPVLHGLA